MNAKFETAWKKTRKLPDLSAMSTQHLVKLESCRNCQFLLFPGDPVCSSCGAPVPAATPRDSAAGHHPDRSGFRAHRIVWIAVSVVALSEMILLFRGFYLKFGRVNTMLFLAEWLVVAIMFVVAILTSKAGDCPAENKNAGD